MARGCVPTRHTPTSALVTLLDYGMANVIFAHNVNKLARLPI
jgi:hypothetical protein